jgi:hypothetical protein
MSHVAQRRGRAKNVGLQFQDVGELSRLLRQGAFFWTRGYGP